MSVQLLTDRPHGIEWYECSCCGAQSHSEPLDTLRRPESGGLECYECTDAGCDC